MYSYIPNSEHDREQMLQKLGISSVDELFLDIPEDLRIKGNLNMESSKSELEIRRLMSGLAGKNINVDQNVCFLGAGAYDHYIPSVVNHLSSRTEYYTSYTPYQPEIAQATLRVIFEYQSYISKLTGLSISNASLYDGATAVAEAALMSIASVKKADKVLISSLVNPISIQVLKTYCKNRNIEVVEIASNNGQVDQADLKSHLCDKVGAVIVQSPNYYGIIEDVKAIGEVVHGSKAKYVVSVDPITLSYLNRPGDLGADIAVGDAQAFGIPLSFGGPYLGFMACTDELARKMPGRIVGESVDKDGNRAFVLTLQAREQHIRRYKATSNICSNQGLMAVRATIYMSTMGKSGLREVAEQCVAKSHYMADELAKTGKAELLYDAPFFKEFAMKFQAPAKDILKKLEENGIFGGVQLDDHTLLIAVTEKRTQAEIDLYVKTVKEA